MNWIRALAHPVPYTKPKRGERRILADARAYAIKRDRAQPTVHGSTQ
jgi:hypothetical protein